VFRLKYAIAATVVAGLVGTVAAATVTGPASASTGTVAGSRILVHFDFAKGQAPENLVTDPRGVVDVTLAFSRQVVRVDAAGKMTVLATLPAPVAATKCPILNTPSFLSGIVRAGNGDLFVNYCTGSADLQGIWRIRAGTRPVRIGALPADTFPNGLAADRSGHLYATDSLRGVVWRLPVRGGTPAVWSADPALRRTGFIGANGLKVHNGAVWVSNLDAGTLVRIGIQPGGTAGAARIRATGLPGVDDFDFVADGCDTVLVALNPSSQVVRVNPATGAHTVVLTAADGLSNPSSVAVGRHGAFVTSAAYFTMTDPNVLAARIR